MRRAPPSFIENYGPIVPFDERPLSVTSATIPSRRVHVAPLGRSKRLRSIADALDACQLKDGAVLSFHHHLRNGDRVLNMVIEAAVARGLKNLTIAASSIFPVHAPLVEHIRRGVVTRIVTSYVSGPVADAISEGLLPNPVVLQTHGGRALAIQSGRLRIDAAFIAAPSADDYGNISGAMGRAACGPLGYAMVDADYADRVVAVTDNLVPFPAYPADIHQDQVDFVVEVDVIGDSAGILSGTTRPTSDPVGLKIAATAAQVIEASGLLDSEFSFQTGAGGISLAVAQQLSEIMYRKGVQGSFAAGGVTGSLCNMLEAGLFRAIFDVQCFDLQAVESYRRDPRHLAMSASLYANPHNRGAVVNRLKTMILGAAEVDLGFNVNVTTGSTGRILGGSGGHSDTADGAELAIVTTRLAASSGPKIVEQVTCRTTPGSTIDVVVSEVGVAVSPQRPELAERLRGFGLCVMPIEALQAAAAREHPPALMPPAKGRIVAISEYRDGSVIDLIHAVGADRSTH